MTTQDTTLTDVLDGRRATYRLLARMFRTEADAELLDTLGAMRFPADTGVAAVDRGHRLIVSYLSQADADVLTELARDYTRTFIGAGNDGFSAAYPNESVYTSPKRLTMQDARDEVLMLYRAAGLEKRESEKEGEDHIAYELEFVAILIDRAIDALDRDDEELAVSYLMQQRNFLADHLLRWYPMMAEDIEKFSQTAFYRGLGKLTAGFLANDGEFLSELLEDVEDESAKEGDE